ncbi:MAG: DUF2141 domain-containing protein [Crocinitomicaceae bacterium]
MKIQLLYIFLLCVLNLHSQQTYDLSVVVTNLENNDGVLQFGLYNNAEKFPIVGETYKMVRVKTSGTSRKYTFKGLPKGNYAVAIYQDENNNDNCDKNFLGVPIEPYAFSNDFRPKLSVPNFKDCSFILDKSKTVTIKLVY